MKRMIAAGLVLILMVCMITASATDAGTNANPLMTESDLSSWFASDLRAEISQALGNATDVAISRLNEVYGNHMGYSFAPRFTRISLVQGSTVSLTTGSSVIMLSGSATLTVSSGLVVNVSTGNAVTSGSQLTRYQRYFCTENTTARIAASSASIIQVDGYYLINGADINLTHLPFTDVQGNAWYFDAIDFVYTNELFTGTTAATFSPGRPMTRGMFVTVLHRLDGQRTSGSAGGFSDVGDPALYYYNAVAWANANGIVTGYTDGTFLPNQDVTREQMASIMYRYAEYKKRNMNTSGQEYNTFPDRGDVSNYAAEAMRWSVSWEVIRGSGGRLLPQNTATRAEVAQIIFNYCEKVGK